MAPDSPAMAPSAGTPVPGIVLRARTSQEAMDLGTAMLRANARSVWGVWFTYTLLPAILFWGLGWLLALPWLGLVLLWGCRPLFDGPILFILSQAAFGQAPTLRDAIRADLRISKLWRLYSVTLGRLSVMRNVRLPMVMLEGAGSGIGAQHRARWRVLSSPLFGAGLGLTLVCIAFEWLVAFSLFVFLTWLLPSTDLKGTLNFIEIIFTRGAAITVFVMAYAAMSLIEPLYVASGFALYLNRRTRIEAWDIGLAFQRLSQRLEAGQRSRQGRNIFGGIALVLAGAMLLPLSAQPARAQPAAQEQQAEARFTQSFDDAVTRAYRDPRFSHEQRVQRWMWRHPLKQQQIVQDQPEPWWVDISPRLANYLFWGLLAAVVLALLIFALRRLRDFLPADEEEPDEIVPPETISISRPAPLPDDLATAVRALWTQSRRREALALLYRGSVQRGATMLGIAPPLEATESDWLRLTRKIGNSTQASQLATIIRTWQLAAYADRYPAESDLDRLLTGWPAGAEAP